LSKLKTTLLFLILFSGVLIPLSSIRGVNAQNSTSIPPIVYTTQFANQTYFFRSDTYTTLGVSGNGIDNDYTNLGHSISETYSGYNTVNYGVRIYVFTSPSRYYEKTSGVTSLFSFGSNFTGLQSAFFSFPLTSVTLGYEAIQINVEEQYNGGSWVTVANFVSPVLITNNIQATTWKLSLYIDNEQYSGNTHSSFIFGTSQYRSCINGMAFSVPNESDIQAWRLSKGDLVGFEIGAYVDVIGNVFYVLILLLFAGVLFFRYGHVGVITFFFVLFGGSGSLIFIVFSNAMWIVAPTAALLILSFTMVVWRIIR